MLCTVVGRLPVSCKPPQLDEAASGPTQKKNDTIEGAAHSRLPGCGSPAAWPNGKPTVNSGHDAVCDCDCACAVAAYEMLMRLLGRRRMRVSVPCPSQAARLGASGPQGPSLF